MDSFFHIGLMHVADERGAGDHQHFSALGQRTDAVTQLFHGAVLDHNGVHGDVMQFFRMLLMSHNVPQLVKLGGIGFDQTLI